MRERLLLRLYGLSLRAYPTDFRSRFGREMSATFSAVADDLRDAGVLARLRFVCAETAAVIVSAAREWVVKAASDPIARARALPDCRRMRPVGLTRPEWASGLDDVG